MTTTTAEAALRRVPNAAEVEWRLERLSHLGANNKLAAEIAESDVDLHDVERMIKGGCTLTLAWKIRKPFEWELPYAPGSLKTKTETELASWDARKATS